MLYAIATCQVLVAQDCGSHQPTCLHNVVQTLLPLVIISGDREAFYVTLYNILSGPLACVRRALKTRDSSRGVLARERIS